MKSRQLKEEQLLEMEQLLKDGDTPLDISNHFGIAVSTVHNYKNILKERGIELPNVRGKRPRGNTDMAINASLIDNDTIAFVVNGVSIKIGKNAKQVIINGNSVIVNF